MPEVTKTKKIVKSVAMILTEEEIITYIVAGLKREFKELKDYKLDVGFALGDMQLSATVEGERVS